MEHIYICYYSSASIVIYPLYIVYKNDLPSSYTEWNTRSISILVTDGITVALAAEILIYIRYSRSLAEPREN